MILSEPFPHLVVDNFLDEELFEALLKNYPQSKDIRTAGSISSKNRFNFMRHSDSQKKLVEKDPWKTFDAYLKSSFISEMLDAFKSSIEQYSASFKRGELECGYDISRASSGYKRSCHLDRRHHLIAFLLYFNEQRDYGGKGGDLILYESQEAEIWDKFPHPDTVTIGKIIEPKKNRFVAFLNTHNSYHGITALENNTSDRIFLYASIDCKTKETVWPSERVEVINEKRRQEFINE